MACHPLAQLTCQLRAKCALIGTAYGAFCGTRGAGSTAAQACSGVSKRVLRHPAAKFQSGHILLFLGCPAAFWGWMTLPGSCTTKLRLLSRSFGSTSTFSLLQLYVGTFEPELRENVFFTTAALQSCDFRAGAPGVRFLYYGSTTKLRLSSRSSGSTFSLLQLYYILSSRSCGSTLSVLQLHYIVAFFEPELRNYVFFTTTTAVLQSCDF